VYDQISLFVGVSGFIAGRQGFYQFEQLDRIIGRVLLP
jgi:hypothetical protein